jgi:hypothetical protein
MKTAAIAVVAWAALFVNGQSLAADLKDTLVGGLICSVGDHQKGRDENSARGTSAPPAKQDMLCLFRNKHTGVEETYHGSFRSAGATMAPRNRTLIWDVNISPGTPIKAGVLGQRYEASEASEINNKAPVSVEGDAKPGVSLRLVSEKKDDTAFLSVLILQLDLVASSA